MIYYYIISHVLGDFYFQSQELSDYKEISRRGVKIHNIQYALTFIILMMLRIILIRNTSPVLLDFTLTLIFIFIHATIDVLKFRLTKTSYLDDTQKFQYDYTVKRDRFIESTRLNGFKKLAMNDVPRNDSDDEISNNGKKTLAPITIFGIDQFCHLFFIVMIYKLVCIWFDCSFYKELLSNDFQMYLSMILVVLLVAKPANILIVMLTDKFDPKQMSVDEGLAGAGARMGTLERLLTLLFLSQNLVSGIAVVFTLKGIARYKKISDNAKFAEYFVIGTFTSLLIVFIVYIFIFELKVFEVLVLSFL
ncbi:DUF3307 domain-containing protein [Erysipelothrix urinaevulpis]|uniref:DUF3307 domain-containing protein n=1 Tax=Erysipelothrix urinaevulpis TaxID=2683717 RepID=UPI00135B9E30|nr:DUF3307 domain-containing protein [Erysipelothrix urinaevulpis]